MPIHAHATCSGCFSACLPSPTGRCRACRGLPALEKGEPLEISTPAAPTQPTSPQRPSAVPALPDPRIRRYAKGENVLTPRPGSLPPPVPRPRPALVAVEEPKKLCGFCSKELPSRAPGTIGHPPAYCDRACKRALYARRAREKRGAAPPVLEPATSAPAPTTVLPVPVLEPAVVVSSVAPGSIDPVDWINLVWKIATKLAAKTKRHADAGEFVGLGWEGLLAAVRNFDPTRGVKFGAYASSRIFGAMVDGFRAETGWRKKGRRNTVLLSTFEGEDGDAWHPSVTPEADDSGESLQRLRRALEDLDPRTRAGLLVDVKKGRRRDDSETLRQVAERFGIGESRMSQIRTNGLEELRARLAGVPLAKKKDVDVVLAPPEDPEARRDLLGRFAAALEVRARREAEKQAVLELVSLHGSTHHGKWRVRGARVGSWIDLETRDPILALERARDLGGREEVVEARHGGLYDRGGEGIWYVDTHVDGRRVHRSLRTRDRAEAERRVGEIRDKLGREALERAGVLDPPLPKIEGGARFYLVRWKHQNRRGEHVESPFWYARLLAGERTKTVTTRCEDREAAAIVAARLLSKFAADEPCTIGRLPNGSGKKEPGTTVKIGQGLIDDLAIALPGVPLGVAVRRLLIEALSFREVYGDPIRESVSSSGGQA